MARPMTVQDRSDFVSVAEAARRLGVSTATVKRRIAAGTLGAEQPQRPQGFEYRVRLTRDVPAPSSERSDSEPVAPFSGTTQDVSAAITAAVAPLAARLIVQDDTIERQAGSSAIWNARTAASRPSWQRSGPLALRSWPHRRS